MQVIFYILQNGSRMARRRALPQQHTIEVCLAAARLSVVEAVEAHIRLRHFRRSIVERIGQVGRDHH